MKFEQNLLLMQSNIQYYKLHVYIPLNYAIKLITDAFRLQITLNPILENKAINIKNDSVENSNAN